MPVSAIIFYGKFFVMNTKRNINGPVIGKIIIIVSSSRSSRSYFFRTASKYLSSILDLLESVHSGHTAPWILETIDALYV